MDWRRAGEDGSPKSGTVETDVHVLGGFTTRTRTGMEWDR